MPQHDCFFSGHIFRLFALGVEVHSPPHAVTPFFPLSPVTPFSRSSPVFFSGGNAPLLSSSWRSTLRGMSSFNVVPTKSCCFSTLARILCRHARENGFFLINCFPHDSEQISAVFFSRRKRRDIVPRLLDPDFSFPPLRSPLPFFCFLPAASPSQPSVPPGRGGLESASHSFSAPSGPRGQVCTSDPLFPTLNLLQDGLVLERFALASRSATFPLTAPSSPATHQRGSYLLAVPLSRCRLAICSVFSGFVQRLERDRLFKGSYRKNQNCSHLFMTTLDFQRCRDLFPLVPSD